MPKASASTTLLRAAALFGLGLLAVACERQPRRIPHRVTSLRPEAPCPTELAEKLGIPFVRVCGEASEDAYWIAASPLHCSAGEHETLECPLVTPWISEPELTPERRAPRRVLRVPANEAHRTCAMRFGGRLPTPEELRTARSRQGLATLVASEEAGGLRLGELEEWTAHGDCGNPSLPGPRCLFERRPATSDSTRFTWETLRACELGRAQVASSPREALGSLCPGANDVCFFRSPHEPHPDSPPEFLAARCAAPEAPLTHPAPRPDVAAFRCVLPKAAAGALH